MFCPQCHVEYRPGFTHCTDCDADLVDAPPLARPEPAAWVSATWERAAQVRTYHSQLWRGTDPHLYLSLVGGLRSKNVNCLGRPTTLPVPRSSGDGEWESFAQPEFEVRVSQENVPFAMRILESTKEDYGKESPFEEAEKDDAGKAGVTPAVVCPLCSAEFPEGTPRCPNCSVPLLSKEDASLPENSPRFLANIPHPLFFAMLRKALLAENIPFSNGNFYDYDRILGLQFAPSHLVLVLDRDFERASSVLARVLQHWEFETGAGLRWVRGVPQSFQSRRAVESGWIPEDLEVRVWTGRNVDTLEFVAVVLREHEIAYRMVDEEQKAAVFAHAEDEEAARKIVQEIAEGEPAE